MFFRDNYHAEEANWGFNGYGDHDYCGEGGYGPRQAFCKYCGKEISFHGKVPWNRKTNSRHECDFSALLAAGDR